jgi:methionyl-tRNA formyltransferase
LQIVFAGTPEFTLPCLNTLANSRHRLLAIYTQPDRPSGRGRKLQPSAVKRWALANQVAIYQPLHFKDEDTIANLAALQADIIVVIAYGLILPKRVLALPRLGCINVHASLLPHWRGPSPIQHAILHGDKETGVTIMQMDASMDTGDILAKVSCPIYPKDTAGSLHDRLAQLAIAPLLATLDALDCGQANPEAQDNNQASYTGKIKKEDAAINWHKTAIEIDRQIRAFNPWPIAYTHASDELLRIHRAEVVANSTTDTPGTIIAIDKKGMLVATAKQTLKVEIIQFPGAKAMAVADWLNAKRSQLQVGTLLR